MLTMERNNVIIGFARESYGMHTKSIVFRYWRIFVEQSKRETRDWNALATQFWTHERKQTFLRA
jgi:hypothetical protein